MERGRPTRYSAATVTLDPNLRCQRVYPAGKKPRTLDTLETVGIRLTRDQAIHLARVLLAVTQDWNEVEITGYRFEQRQSDGTSRLTVTSLRYAPQGQRLPRRPPGTTPGTYRDWDVRVAGTDYGILDDGENWFLLGYDPDTGDPYQIFEDVETFLTTHNLLLSD